MALKFNSTIKGGDLSSITAKIEADLNAELRLRAINLIARLAFVTPKKTGEATGEWQATIDRPASSRTLRKDLTGLPTAAEERAVIESAKTVKFPTIYISNLAGHIEDLNNGTSQQEPAKFIERALLEAVSAKDIRGT